MSTHTTFSSEDVRYNDLLCECGHRLGYHSDICEDPSDCDCTTVRPVFKPKDLPYSYARCVHGFGPTQCCKECECIMKCANSCGGDHPIPRLDMSAHTSSSSPSSSKQSTDLSSTTKVILNKKRAIRDFEESLGQFIESMNVYSGLAHKRVKTIDSTKDRDDKDVSEKYNSDEYKGLNHDLSDCCALLLTAMQLRSEMGSVLREEPKAKTYSDELENRNTLFSYSVNVASSDVFEKFIVKLKAQGIEVASWEEYDVNCNDGSGTDIVFCCNVDKEQLSTLICELYGEKSNLYTTLAYTTNYDSTICEVEEESEEEEESSTSDEESEED